MNDDDDDDKEEDGIEMKEFQKRTRFSTQKNRSIQHAVVLNYNPKKISKKKYKLIFN